MEHSVTYIVVASTLIIIVLLRRTRSKQSLDIPFFSGNDNDPEAPRKRWMTDSINLLQEGLAKYPNRVFRVWTTEGTQFVIPPRYLNELKMKPDHTLPSALADFFQGRHTTFTRPDRPNRIVPALRNEMNKNLPDIFLGMVDEVECSLPREFPQNLHEWTPVKVYGMVARVVFRISARAFAGADLHRNDQYMLLNLDYTRAAFAAALQIRRYPEWLRAIAKYFVTEVQQLWRYNKQAAALMAPYLKERDLASKQPDYIKPHDTIEWIRDLLPDWEKKDVEYQAIQQLGIGAASVFTTSGVLTHVLYDLATYPEYLTILRDEVAEVLAQHDSKWTFESMLELKKMDSFIKESQRMSPPTISFQRRIDQPLILSDGTRIPKNAFLLAPAAAISHDPAIYDHPDDFDGMRFYNMRQIPGEENKHQFVSISNTQLHFGAGRHACPGRWFASHGIKLMFAKLITDYDIKTLEGKGRPRNILYQASFAPDPEAEILLRSRKNALG